MVYSFEFVEQMADSFQAVTKENISHAKHDFHVSSTNWADLYEKKLVSEKVHLD